MEKIIKNYRKIWWTLLLLLSSIYFIVNYNRITNTPTAIDSLVTVCLIILAFMPLISEISLLGMSVKKELEQTKNEMRKDVLSIKNDIIGIALSNQNNNSFYLGADRIPTSSEIQNEINLEKKVSNENEDNTESKESYTISESNVFLFKTRLILEKKLEDIAKQFDIRPNKSMRALISILRDRGIITTVTEDKLMKVLSICNRGVHGELVDEEYISYVKVILKEVESGIIVPQNSRSKDMNRFTVCNRCGYTGAAYYDNECPNCGYISCCD
ncbi:hypothetical protein [Fusibacter bizertensis]